jgi:hypothetical protein
MPLMRSLSCSIYLLLLLVPKNALAGSSNKIYDDLYWLISNNALSPERPGCVNRTPFGVGYECGPDRPGFPYSRGGLIIDSVQLSRFESTITTWLHLSDKNCISVRKFENRLRSSNGGHAVRFLRSYDVYGSDGGGHRRVDYFGFSGSKINLTYELGSGRTCITEISIEKRA